MNRKNFIQLIAGGGALISSPLLSLGSWAQNSSNPKPLPGSGLRADLVIAGGGLGGCAAAIAALRNNLTVILTEETDWIGGQLTQQGVPPDEHRWIETHGATQAYRDLRKAIRQYYFDHYPLTEAAKANPRLNPGNGAVSLLCHEPRVALAVLLDLFAPYLSNRQLILLTETQITEAQVDGNKVKALKAKNLKSGREIILEAPYFADATELGELLPLTGTEFVTGTESRKETGELHAPEQGDPENNQAFTMCFAADYLPGEDHTIQKPEDYAFWRDFIPQLTPPWPGKLLDLNYSTPSTLQPKSLGFHPAGISTDPLLNLWNYRRILDQKNFLPGSYRGDITVVNWPQNDYTLGNLIGVSEEEFNRQVDQSKQLSLSLLYWLQTEAPRPDGGLGWPGIRLRNDIMGTDDGLAKYPYIRESRRIKARFTILEEHVGKEQRALVAGASEGLRAANFHDSVGIGYYHIDLHPSNKGNNYIDFPSLPFQIPLGALLPQRMENLLPANKNIGTTHITNGCYRLHPVEWSIGEAVGMLVAYSLDRKVLPQSIHENKNLLTDFQNTIQSQGIETRWKA